MKSNHRKRDDKKHSLKDYLNDSSSEEEIEVIDNPNVDKLIEQKSAENEEDKPYGCNICDSYFSSDTELVDHIAMIHDIDESQEEEQSDIMN